MDSFNCLQRQPLMTNDNAHVRSIKSATSLFSRIVDQTGWKPCPFMQTIKKWHIAVVYHCNCFSRWSIGSWGRRISWISNRFQRRVKYSQERIWNIYKKAIRESEHGFSLCLELLYVYCWYIYKLYIMQL